MMPVPDCIQKFLATLSGDDLQAVYLWAVNAAPSNDVSLAIQDATQSKGNDVYE